MTLNSLNTPSTMFALILPSSCREAQGDSTFSPLSVPFLIPSSSSCARGLGSNVSRALPLAPVNTRISNHAPGRRGSRSVPSMHLAEKQNIPTQITMVYTCRTGPRGLRAAEVEMWCSARKRVRAAAPRCLFCHSRSTALQSTTWYYRAANPNPKHYRALHGTTEHVPPLHGTTERVARLHGTTYAWRDYTALHRLPSGPRFADGGRRTPGITAACEGGLP
ncbi:hypothetical protein DFH09DRAFT_1085804 [Mycena vulgaris]|nr:hypothetical protein DFH09DRAFT_1085804 [Mycena vulgaris]